MKVKIGKLEVDPKEVFQAYATMFTASESEKKHAELRRAVCAECPHLVSKEFLSKGYHTCGICGCVIEAKVYTKKVEDTCPENKWRQVDVDFIKNSENKKVSSLL